MLLIYHLYNLVKILYGIQRLSSFELTQSISMIWLKKVLLQLNCIIKPFLTQIKSLLKLIVTSQIMHSFCKIWIEPNCLPITIYCRVYLNRNSFIFWNVKWQHCLLLLKVASIFMLSTVFIISITMLKSLLEPKSGILKVLFSLLLAKYYWIQFDTWNINLVDSFIII
jgi:hypothetical protein